MRKILIGAVLFSAFQIANAQSRHQEIKNKLSDLQPLLGQWKVRATYTSRKGEVRIENGTYEINWALDSTYIRWFGELTNEETDRTRQFESWITYDRDQNAIRQVYFNSRTASQIIEFGTFDQASQTLETSTTFDLPDGVKEVMRTELPISNSDELIYRSYAKFDDAEEVNNFTAILTRQH